MTTDEMILTLVASGKFTLPEAPSDRGRIKVSPCYVEEHCYPGENGFCNLGTFAYDVIAMEFARRASELLPVPGSDGDIMVPRIGERTRGQMWRHLMVGDSEAAIRALYEAVIGEEAVQ